MIYHPATRSEQPTIFLVKAFWPLIAIIALVKVWLAYFIPLTGDEAYFDLWARYPALGYYDHPPMVGWWLITIQGMPPVLLRLPALFVSFIPGIVILWLFARSHPVSSRLASLIALTMPLFMFGIGISTDTPIVLFGVLALALCQKAFETRRDLFWLLGGMALGLAFLSKYFAVLLGIGIVVHILLRYRPLWTQAMRAIVLLFFGVTPAIILNLWWNYCNCWYNIQFNLISRNTGAGFNLEGTAVYLVMLIYTLTPWVVWALWRNSVVLRHTSQIRRVELWLIAGVVGLIILGLLSMFRNIGLHWLAVFLPGLVLVLPLLPIVTLQRLAWASLSFAGLHTIALVSLLSMSHDQLAGLVGRSNTLSTVEFYRFPERIAERVAERSEGRPVFTVSYSRSAVLTYYMDETVGVFGTGSRYGRQFDVLSDFAALDGADLVILLFDLHLEPEFAMQFESYQLQEIGRGSSGPWLFEGQAFDFSHYQATTLNKILEQYYQLPNWLPTPRCDFITRYELTPNGV